MADSPWVTVRGVEQARAKFQMATPVVKARLLEAAETTVQEIARSAQSRILRSPSVRTRALYNAIDWSVSKATGFARVGVARTTTLVGSLATRSMVRVRGTVVSFTRGGQVVQEAVQPTKYAHLVEFGTEHMPAEPFMSPSADEEKPRHVQRCLDARSGIEQGLG